MFEIKERQVHMDFHLSGEVPNVGANFDEDAFITRLKKSHINAVTVFAKCHHGYFYYRDSAYAVHPHLKTDLLPRQLAACEKAGIETAVYVSAGFDEVLAEQHRDWVYRGKDGSTARAASFEDDGYHFMCFQTPYLDVLCAQTEEVMRKCMPGEIFFDICEVRPCYCEHCRRYRSENGISEDDASVVRHAEQVYAEFCRRTAAAIRKYSATCRIFYNGGHFYRGRRDLANYNTHYEIESLPTGGWGYDHFPLTVNYLEQLGREYLGMTGKFNTTWAEFGGYKHRNALFYEAGLFLCYGAKCSVGDQINYDGTLDEHTYDMIGFAYRHVENCEKYVFPSKKRTEIGVCSVEDFTGEYNPASDRGVNKILLRGKYQFDFVDSESDFSKYKLILLPDRILPDKKFEEKLRAFVRSGGKLLASGESAVKDGAFLFDFGAEFAGKETLAPSYFDGAVLTGCPAHNVVYSDSYRIRCTGEELGKKFLPLQNRQGRHFCAHQHWPEDPTKRFPGITEGKDGIYLCWKIFEDFANFAPSVVRDTLFVLLDRLLGRKLVETNLPSQAIATLRTQEKCDIVQALYGVPYQAGGNLQVIDDIPILYHTKFSVAVRDKVQRVVNTADGTELAFEQCGERVEFVLPEFWCHALILIDYKKI